MKRFTPLLYFTLAAFAAIAPFCAAPPQAVAQQQQKSLYRRLGGYDALAAVTDDFLGRLPDGQLKRFFVGHNKTGVTRIRQHVIDFLCVAIGGPCAYTVQDMKTAHTGLGYYRGRMERVGETSGLNT